MTTFAIFLVLISAFLSPARDFLTKQSKDKPLFMWWLSLVAFFMIAPLAIFLILTTEVRMTSVLFALGVGFIHSTFWIFMAKAYEGGDISHVYPIIRSAPALILILALIFLNEQVTSQGVLGILSITMGLYVINMKRISLNSFLDPLRSIVNEVHTRWAVLALLSMSVFYIFDKIGVELLNPVVYAFIATTSALCWYTLFIVRGRSKKAWMEPWQKNRKHVFLAAFFAAVNYPLFLYALQVSNVSYISAFKQISVLIAVIMGHRFLKEGNPGIRYAAAGLILIGAVLIAVG